MQFMNETDRTTVALLWHENVGRSLENLKLPNGQLIETYVKILDNICFADYISRITFQNQIWQFNEMCSLIKTFYNNRILHSLTGTTKPAPNPIKPTDVEFTKVLTKYSTEFNNQGFIYGLCQQMNMDRSDVIALFIELKMLLLMDCNSSNNLLVQAKQPPNSPMLSADSFCSVETKPDPVKRSSKKSTNVTVYAGIEFSDADIKIWLQKVQNTLSYYEVEMLDIKRMYRFLDTVDKTILGAGPVQISELEDFDD